MKISPPAAAAITAALLHPLAAAAAATTTKITATATTATTAKPSTGNVYILEPAADRSAVGPETLTPTAARLVLAHRAGVEEFHSADLWADGVLEAINAYGARTPSLLRPVPGQLRRRRRGLILFEDVGEVDNVETAIPRLQLATTTHFSLAEPAPGMSDSEGLWVDFVRQAADPENKLSADDDELVEMLKTFPPSVSSDLFFTIVESVSDLRTLLQEMQDDSITLYITPPASEYTNATTKASWGTYTLPATSVPANPLRKRAPILPSESPLRAEDSVSTSPLTPLQPRPPPAGLLPACFPSLSSCLSQTSNCTSHGSCTLKFTTSNTGSSGGSGGTPQECWACACTPTIHRDSDERVTTTYWGGPACQKRDVSVPFWMLAGLGTGLVFLVGFAVGEVWGMGKEELPGVIGAGVSGVVKR